MTPSEKMSLAGPRRSISPAACSGDMYHGVPITVPVTVIFFLPSSFFRYSLARPKSVSLGLPSAVRRMFSGLRSRWMIP